jgi:hypothetical protein
LSISQATRWLWAALGNQDMKAIRIFSVILCAAALCSGSVLAADETKPCCAATVEAGKKCEHKCCQKAAEKGKVCKKCHPAKGEEKK